MKKLFLIILGLVFVLSFPSVANAQITKEQYYARSTLTESELEFYDACYDIVAAGDTGISNDYGISNERAKEIVNYVWADSPELFRQGDLYTDEEAAALQVKIDAKVDEILSLVTDDMTDYEKVKTVYIALGKFIENDPEASESIDNGEMTKAVKESQTIVSGLVYGKSVCAGTARSLQYILYKLDIPCVTIDGYLHNGGGHSWNIIQVDGEWYHADLYSMLFFCKHGGLEYILMDDNRLKESSLTLSDLNPPLPKCTSTKYMDDPQIYTAVEPTPTPTPTPQPTAAPIKATIIQEPETPEEATPPVPEEANTNPALWILLGAGIAAAIIIPIIRKMKKNA